MQEDKEFNDAILIRVKSNFHDLQYPRVLVSFLLILLDRFKRKERI